MGIVALLFAIAGITFLWFLPLWTLSLASSLLALGFSIAEAFRSKTITLPVAAGIVLALLALLLLAFFHRCLPENNELRQLSPSEMRNVIPTRIPQTPPAPEGGLSNSASPSSTTVATAPAAPAPPARQSGAPITLPESGIAPELPSSSSEPSPALPPPVSAPPSNAASPPAREELPANAYSLPAEMLPANATSLPAEMKPANATSLPAEMKPANATSLPATLVPR